MNLKVSPRKASARIGVLLLLGASGSAIADEAANKVLDCMRAAVPDAMRVSAIELRAIDQLGEARKFKGRLFVVREKAPSGKGSLMRATLRIDRPDNLNGVSYLVRENDVGKPEDVYVYMPAVRRVRRVSSSFAEGAVLGTNISYNDLKQLANSWGDIPVTAMPASEIEKRAVHVLEFKPVPGKGVPYSPIVMSVDQKTCLPLKITSYDGKTALKEYTAPVAGLRQSHGAWYLSEIQMRDLQDNSKTILTVDSVDVGDKMAPRYFNPTQFYQGD